jgi:hypothetical protein
VSNTSVLSYHEPKKHYRIVSRVELPLYMRGLFTFAEAYELSCEWNQDHSVRNMAWPEYIFPEEID